jgi:hypothetical protein
MSWGIVALWVITILSAGVSYAQARSAQKEARKQARQSAQQAQAALLNRKGTIEQIPVVYGTRRVGGVRVFARSGEGGADQPNDVLYLALVFCEGEVESVTDIYFDGEPLSGSKYIPYVTYWTYTGSPTQTADPTLIAASGGDWTTDHKLSGLAYIVLKLTMSGNPEKNPWAGVPDITALIKGKKVYDPRTLTTAWSDNPALCIRDYLTNNLYGKGLDTSAINDTLFGDAADELDTTEVLVTGDIPEKPYRCDAVLDTDEKLIDNIQSLLTGCRGFLPYSNGQYALVVDVAGASVLSITEDTLIGEISVEGEDKASKYNQVVVTFPNPLMDYQADDAFYPTPGDATDVSWLATDGERLKYNFETTTLTSKSAATNLAKIIALRSRDNLKLAFNTTSEAANLIVGDVVDITLGSTGWVSKLFKVETVALNSDGSIGLSLREYVPGAYAYQTIAEDPNYPTSTLPDAFNVVAPTNLQVTESTQIGNDGSLVPALAVNWTASTDAFVSYYEVQWKLTTDSNYNSINVNSTDYLITGAYVGNDYDIRVRAVNGISSKSSWLGGTSGALVGDTTAPALPTTLLATASLNEIILTWVNPTDYDFSHVEIYENGSNDFGTSTQIAVSSGDFFVRSGLGYGVARYYWFKSVDYSGNISTQSAAVSATTLYVDSSAFEDGVVNLFLDQGAGAVDHGSSFPVTPADNDKFFYTIDGKLYQYDLATTTWELMVESGSILASDKIIANSITGGLIAASGVITTSAQIDDAVITGANIASAAITNAKIGDAAVDTLQLAGQAVTIPSSTFTSTFAKTDMGTAASSFTLSGRTLYAPYTGTEFIWATAQTITYTSTGNPVNLMFTSDAFAGLEFDDGNGTGPFAGAFMIQWEILNGATVIATGLTVHDNYGYGGATVLETHMDQRGVNVFAITDDTPTAGSVTYSFKLRPVWSDNTDFQDSGELAVRNRTGQALEVKR